MQDRIEGEALTSRQLRRSNRANQANHSRATSPEVISGIGREPPASDAGRINDIYENYYQYALCRVSPGGIFCRII